MTAENFAYWMQGLLELNPDLKTLDEKQVKMIREHLGYVFSKHIVPPATPTNPTIQPYLPLQPSLPPYTPKWAAPIIECSTSGTVSDSVMTTYC